MTLCDPNKCEHRWSSWRLVINDGTHYPFLQVDQEDVDALERAVNSELFGGNSVYMRNCFLCEDEEYIHTSEIPMEDADVDVSWCAESYRS